MAIKLRGLLLQLALLLLATATPAAPRTPWKTDDMLTPSPLPRTWGFNYDRTYPAEAGGCAQILADLLAMPPESADAIDAKLRADFTAMRRMNGTAVRLVASLDSLVTAPTELNQTAMALLQRVVDLAAESSLTVDLTGANVMRQPGGPHPFPSWLAVATDAELRVAQRTFWTGCARQFKGSDTILGFNLLNEPVSPTKPTTDFAIGCFASTPNGSAFGPQCHDGLCYCNHVQRSPYNSSFMKGWCSEMVNTKLLLCFTYKEKCAPGQT
jgi:hypothetical protein